MSGAGLCGIWCTGKERALGARGEAEATLRSPRVQNKTVVPVRRSALIRKIGDVQRDIQG